jgi:class 3 adenylate cyclase/tetratricopeptide (TPR) repeat protein
MSSCPACGRENPEGFNFCGACGAALSTTAVREERKVVTVLFADLVGFTARAEQMDPEDVRALLVPYHAHVREELERYGGTVEKFIGDAVMALFGAPIAHEDDPERAVRAALSIRDWAREQDGEIQLRIAVNTGEALVALGSKPDAGQGMASGDVVNTAARLQAAAPVNAILVGEATYRATRHAIDYRDALPVAAKGKTEPVRVWEALQTRAAQGVDLLRDVRTPLVGRTRELDALRGGLERARAERTPQLVTVVGVPGIGKSRLVYELMQVVEADPELITWRQGRSLPYGEGVSFWPVAEMIKAEAGILESDSPVEVIAKLEHAVESVGQHDAGWLTSHLQRVVGAGESFPLSEDRRSEAFAAWREFFESVAEQGPLVLVFEDLHWADDGTLDFVDHLVEWAGAVPLLIVGTARPELLNRRPAWGGGKINALTLALAPLSDDDTARLISSLADRPLLDARAQRSLLDHAEGNPLYAEQYVRMVAERESLEDLPLPETVHGIIAARLDALPNDEKTLLQDAAVLGKVFWRGAVAALREEDAVRLDERLHALERKEFVQRARRTSVAGEAEYTFRHILVRDVAYGLIPRARRAERHERAAEWIASLGRADEHAEMIAHHLTTALDYARAAGMDTAALERDARRALRSAAARADDLGALTTAVSLYERLLALIPAGDGERGELLYRYIRARADDAEIDDALIEEARSELDAAGDNGISAEAEVTFASLFWLRGDRAGSQTAVERALALIADEEPSPSKAQVLAQTARFAMLAGDDARAILISEEALELAERFHHVAAHSRALNTIGCSRINLGDDTGLDYIERSLEVAEAANSLEAWQAAGNHASMLFQLGHLSESDEMRKRTIAIGERFGVVAYVRWQRAEEAEMLYRLGRWAEAARIIDEWLLEAEQSAYYMEAPTRGLRSRLRLAHDDVAGAVADGVESLELAQRIQDPQVFQPASAWRALLAIETGAPRDAVAPFDELVRRRTGASATGGYAYGDVDTAWAARALGRVDEVEAIFVPQAAANRWARAALHIIREELAAATEVLELIGSTADLAYARLRLAQALVEAGRRSEADEQLAAALAFYRSVGATRYVREGEALLAVAS